MLEARDSAGGRVRSVYADPTRTDTLLYESGPWRIPEEHLHMLRLCTELKLTLQPLKSPHRRLPEPPPDVRGLSNWDSRAYATLNPTAADAADLATGYAGQTHAAAGSEPYAAADSRRFFTVAEGFSEIAKRMLDRLTDDGGEVRFDHRVTDVVRDAGGGYSLRVLQRDRRAGTFDTLTVHADALFVCIPPSQARCWTAMHEHALPVLDAVEANCLNHVYARSSTYDMGAFHRRSATSLLGQSISDQYGSGWFQASYSAGRLARFWSNLHIVDAVTMRDLLRRQLRRWPFAGKVLKCGPGPDADDVRVHFWEEAYHSWRPGAGFDLARAVANAVTPHPFRLPAMYLAGEAFSSKQAWMEGAVETAIAAVDAYVDRADGRPQRGVRARSDLSPTTEIVVDGRIVDVTAFAAVHPGGMGAIKSHMADRDVDQLMRHVGHSARARSLVFYLQTGWLDEE